MRGFALGLVVLAGCGSGGTDIAADLQFADLTDAQIGRLISAASGADMFSAQSRIDELGSTFGTPDPCPAIAVDGSVATITGDCTSVDGVTLEGTATVDNPTSWDQIEWNPGYNTDYTLALSFDYGAGAGVQSYDGTITRAYDFLSWSTDLTVDSFGETVRSDLEYVCTSTATSCSLDRSGVELVGVGGAHVTGTVQIANQATSATYTLTGADTVHVQVGSGCVAWQIEGTDRMMACP